MKYYKLLFCVLAFLCNSCQLDEPIEGHWHFYSNYGLNDTYITIDISKDSIAFLNRNSILEKLKGKIYRSKKMLVFPGECGSGIFTYEVHNSKMFLKGHYDKLIGNKCDSNCCNKIEDFFNDSKVSIDMPEPKNIEKYSTNTINENFQLTFLFGTPKMKFSKFYGDSILLENCGQFYNNLEIENRIEIVKGNFSEQALKYMDVRIIADKKTPIPKISSLIKSLNDKELDKIWLTFFDPKKQELTYIPIHKEESKQKITLMEVFK